MTEQTEFIYRWHQGESQAFIARSLGVSRKTVPSQTENACTGAAHPGSGSSGTL